MNHVDFMASKQMKLLKTEILDDKIKTTNLVIKTEAVSEESINIFFEIKLITDAM